MAQGEAGRTKPDYYDPACAVADCDEWVGDLNCEEKMKWVSSPPGGEHFARGGDMFWDDSGHANRHGSKSMGQLLRDVRRDERTDLRNRFLSIEMDAKVRYGSVWTDQLM